MKKLMIAAAIVCAAAVSQAASLAWSTANYAFMADNSGSAITTQAGYDSLMKGGNIVLVLLEDGTYDGAITALSKVEGVTGANAAFKTSGAGSVKYGAASTVAWEFDSGLISNGDKLGVMYMDKDGALSQLVYVDSTGKVDDAVDGIYTVSGLSGDDSVLTSFKFTDAGTSGSKLYITTAAVPEPTSGLLLLLGIGAMALRRRRA